jgi:hypothetical protein
LPALHPFRAPLCRLQITASKADALLFSRVIANAVMVFNSKRDAYNSRESESIGMSQLKIGSAWQVEWQPKSRPHSRLAGRLSMTVAFF